MSKKIIAVVLVLLVLLSACVFSACGENSVIVSIGENKDSAVNINLQEKTTVQQNKLKIENNGLVYNKSGQGYENLSFYFSGNNIQSIEIESDNKTMIYNDRNKFVLGIDIITMYADVNQEIIDKYQQVHPGVVRLDEQSYIESLWESGEFDDIKHTFANGQSWYDLTRTYSDETVNVYSHGVGSPDTNSNNFSCTAKGKIKESFETEAWYMNKIKTISEPVCQYKVMFYSYGEKEKNGVSKVAVYGKNTQFDYNDENNCILWRYEGLFYNAMKNSTLKYTDISDNMKLTVNYKNGTSEIYNIKLTFNNSGNVIVESEQLK